jgi:transposase
MVLSIEERAFLVEYVFREGNRYTDLVQEQFAEKFPGKPVHHRNAVRRLIEKFRETGSVLDAKRSGRPPKNLHCIVVAHPRLIS